MRILWALELRGSYQSFTQPAQRRSAVFSNYTFSSRVCFFRFRALQKLGVCGPSGCPGNILKSAFCSPEREVSTDISFTAVAGLHGATEGIIPLINSPNLKTKNEKGWRQGKSLAWSAELSSCKSVR